MLPPGHPQGDGQVGFAGADAADQHDVGRLGDEGAAAQRQDRVAVQPRLRIELESIPAMPRGRTGRATPPPQPHPPPRPQRTPCPASPTACGRIPPARADLRTPEQSVLAATFPPN